MENIKTKRGRKWLITINNPTIKFEEIKNIIEKKWNGTIYYCYCEEIGNETHTRHYHIFIYFKNAVKGSSILKTFEGCHLDFCNGTCQENRDYIYKTGKYEGSSKEDTRQEGMQYESGDCPQESKGKRNDLEELKQLIVDGKSNAEIYEINSNYLRFANSLDKMRLDILSHKYGTIWRDVEVTYICGSTGTGKTRGVMDSYGYKNVYRILKDDYSFSTYTMQDVVMFEEFRNTFKLEDMLNLLDGYPIQGRAMQGFRQLGYTKAFICSNWKLEEQYQSIQEEYPSSWQAFLRRINKVIIREKSGDKVFYQKNRGTEENPAYDFISDDGVSYFDPFGLKDWGENEALDFWDSEDVDLSDFFGTSKEEPTRTEKPKQVDIGKSVLGHIFTKDCEYWYKYPCDIEKPDFDLNKCVIPNSLSEYECKENYKEFEKIHRELEAQKQKEEYEKMKKEKELLEEFENVTEDMY